MRSARRRPGCRRAVLAPVAQLAEAAGLNPVQCRFEPCRGHRCEVPATPVAWGPRRVWFRRHGRTERWPRVSTHLRDRFRRRFRMAESAAVRSRLLRPPSHTVGCHRKRCRQRYRYRSSDVTCANMDMAFAKGRNMRHPSTLRVVGTVLAVVVAGLVPAVAAPSGTAAAAPAVVTVASLDFDAATIDPWTSSGGANLAYVDADGGKALSITRAADYEGIQSPVGIFEAGVVYTLSMRARLPEGSALASTDIRFVVKPAYNCVANATITSDGWTEITGTYTVPADVVATETQVSIGSANQTGPYPIMVT